MLVNSSQSTVRGAAKAGCGAQRMIATQPTTTAAPKAGPVPRRLYPLMIDISLRPLRNVTAESYLLQVKRQAEVK